MAILNYTTKIMSAKTVGEIQEMLGRKGADEISLKYNNFEPIAIQFRVDGWVFRLPCNVKGVYEAMKRDRKIPNSHKNVEQATRTAWRIIKDWVEAQLAIIEAGQATMQEVFFPYAVGEDGVTAFKAYSDRKLLIGS
jgi:hypothetical protein